MSLARNLWHLVTGAKGRRRKKSGGPRVMAYCASNIGLGHYGRLCRVLEEVKGRSPQTSLLMVTDARERTLATRAGAAVLSLPGFHFLEDGSFREAPTALDMSNRELRTLRAGVLLSAARSFQPDVLLLDTNPHGKRDELLPLLRWLRRSTRCRVLLMMRDIPAPPGEAHKLAGDPARITKHAALYDRLLLAGDPAFFDAPAAYAWPEPVRRKARFVGFVVPHKRTEADNRRELLGSHPTLDPEAPLVIASFGGGWETEKLLEPLVSAFLARREEQKGRDQLLAVTGPATSEQRLSELRRQWAGVPGLVLERFVPSFAELLSVADRAILQAGSSVFQVLDSAKPILLLCRDYRDPEQEERARRLAALPGIRAVFPGEITGAACREWVEWLLTQSPRQRRTGFSFSGIEAAADEVLQALAAP